MTPQLVRKDLEIWHRFSGFSKKIYTHQDMGRMAFL